MTRLREHYDTVVRPSLMKEFGYKNPLEVPRLEKIVVNMGVGEAVQDVKKVDAAAKELAAITGQKPVVTRAKKSIATFKLRENLPIGRFSRSLKVAMDFFARVTTGFWPVMAASSLAAASTFLTSCTASPTPMLTTIFSRRGTSSGFL